MFQTIATTIKDVEVVVSINFVVGAPPTLNGSTFFYYFFLNHNLVLMTSIRWYNDRQFMQTDNWDTEREVRWLHVAFLFV